MVLVVRVITPPDQTQLNSTGCRNSEHVLTDATDKQVALLSQRGRAMLRVCQQFSFNSTKHRAQSCRKLHIYHCVQLNAILLSLA